jgi:protein-tyrosine phosphatase
VVLPLGRLGSVGTKGRSVLDEDRGQNLLVVCAANVCRSPLAEYLLSTALPSIPEFEGHSVSSAGAKATAGAAICGLVEARLGPDGADFSAAHRARALTREMIGDAAIVLTASTSERAAVALLDPTARPRTFTIREAVALAEADGPPAPDTGALLERFAGMAHARRGLVAAPRPEGRAVARWFRRSAPEPLDVSDGHVLGDKSHEATIVEVRRATERLVAALERIAR